ncbi:MAG TPA: NAD(P)/FAD-dependent oxidoreductase [Actinomycetota bacterium]|nr:NAD(P)/FAD-dependent oxidoreductase [Actinomycetota bacterium]
MTNKRDVVVIGGGAAGLAAATWLGRHRIKTTLLDSGEYRNRWVDQAHGYLGRDPVNPHDLLEQARKDLARYAEVELAPGRVTGAARAGQGFDLEVDGRKLQSQRVILATGVQDEFPEIDGFFEHYGASVFHCPTCDGYEARERKVVVFGWKQQVAGFALRLLDWASEVVLVTDGKPFEGEQECRVALDHAGIRILRDEAVELTGGRGDLRSVRLASGAEVDCDLAFFSIAHHPRNDLAKQLGCDLDDEGRVVVDDMQRTNVRGVYAVGDLTPGVQLLQIAAAKGASAGVCCALSLLDEHGATAEYKEMKEES